MQHAVISTQLNFEAFWTNTVFIYINFIRKALFEPSCYKNHTGTTSPTAKSLWFLVHRLRFCRVWIYSFLHHFQKISARCWALFHWAVYASFLLKGTRGSSLLTSFKISNVYGVMIKGYSGYDEVGTSGREFMIALAPARKVVNISWVNTFTVCPSAWYSICDAWDQSCVPALHPCGKHKEDWKCIQVFGREEITLWVHFWRW